MNTAVMSLWVSVAVVLSVYLLLFAAARRPVSLRPGRLALLLSGAVLVRVLMATCGDELLWPLDGGLTVLALAGAGVLAAIRRFWLVRVTNHELREDLVLACRGLLLGLDEPLPHMLLVSARTEHRLFLGRFGPRLQCLLLCRRPAAGKVRLLVDWLAKQYPGPVPRVRITLSGGKS
jgi:hypothetical protein